MPCLLWLFTVMRVIFTLAYPVSNPTGSDGILLRAIPDHRGKTDDPERQRREGVDQQYLINKWKPEQQRLKLVPTQEDRPAYLACLDSTPPAGGATPVGSASGCF